MRKIRSFLNQQSQQAEKGNGTCLTHTFSRTQKQNETIIILQSLKALAHYA